MNAISIAGSDASSQPSISANFGDLVGEYARRAQSSEAVLSAPAVDAEAAVSFLKTLDPAGRHNLVAITTDSIRGRTFASGSWEDIRAWILAEGVAANLYFSLNEPLPHDTGRDLDRKLSKSDIATIRGVAGDVDPRPDERSSFDHARARVLDRVDGLRSASVPPTITIDSGGGAQPIWLLSEKVPVGTLAGEVEAIGRGIAKALHGDAVQNIDRIFRLPGSINYPNADKIKRGQTKRPASVRHRSEHRYSLLDIARAFPPVESGTANDQSPALAATIAEIRCADLSEVPPSLWDKFNAARLQDAKLNLLWQGDVRGLAGDDRTSSAWRFNLAVRLGLADFAAEDYAQLALAWDIPEIDRDGIDPDTPNGLRQLARDWVRGGLPNTPAVRAAHWFDDPTEQPLFPPEGSAAAGDAPDRTRFRPVPFDEAAEQALSSGGRPLIKGLLDQGAMSVVYGESNSGKTFVALDIAYHVARGLNWAGMRTAQHSALYIAAEGGNGIRRRAGALKTRCGPAGDAFQLLPHTVDLLRPFADLGPLLAMIQQISPAPGLVVIDTLSRALAGGDENSPTDMGALVKHLDALRKASGAHILVVHHSGKDASKGARGHSLLRAATDTEIEIRDGQIAVTKQRDLDGSWSTPFSLEEVELGRDEDGDAITSCVIRLGAGAVGDGPVVSDEDMARIRQRVEAGTWRMTAKGRAKASWIGVAVGLALDIDISSNAGHGYVASIVEALIRSRQLIVTERHNAKTGRTEKIVGLPPAVSSWFDAAAAELAPDIPADAFDGVFG